MRSPWTRPARIVVKVGSAVIARGGTLDQGAITRLVDDVSSVLEGDAEARVVIVSSGAVASGFRALGLEKPPREIVGKQAAAAVGQPTLMSAYARAFERPLRGKGAKGASPRSVAQVLLTADDLDHRARFLNARNTLEALLRAGVVPIINENDSVSFDEIKLGDNDHLAAMVSGLIGADLLVILSSVAGVWDVDALRAASSGDREHARTPIVHEIRSLSEALRHVAPTKTETGVGGMATKVRAACTAAALGTPAVIADGSQAGIVERVVSGERVGTLFPGVSAARASAARKKWIGFSARPKGAIVVDDGARKAIEHRGASLLPGGVRAVNGTFGIGAMVELQDPNRHAFARGIASYASEEIERIAGKKSAEIAGVLGYCYRDEVVHRSQMVLLDAPGVGAPVLVRSRGAGARPGTRGNGGGRA